VLFLSQVRAHVPSVGGHAQPGFIVSECLAMGAGLTWRSDLMAVALECINFIVPFSVIRKKYPGGLVQCVVQTAFGETEGLSAVNQQNVHADSSEVVLKACHCPSILHAGKWQ